MSRPTRLAEEDLEDFDLTTAERGEIRLASLPDAPQRLIDELTRGFLPLVGNRETATQRAYLALVVGKIAELSSVTGASVVLQSASRDQLFGHAARILQIYDTAEAARIFNMAVQTVQDAERDRSSPSPVPRTPPRRGTSPQSLEGVVDAFAAVLRQSQSAQRATHQELNETRQALLNGLQHIAANSSQGCDDLRLSLGSLVGALQTVVAQSGEAHAEMARRSSVEAERQTHAILGAVHQVQEQGAAATSAAATTGAETASALREITPLSQQTAQSQPPRPLPSNPAVDAALAASAQQLAQAARISHETAEAARRNTESQAGLQQLLATITESMRHERASARPDLPAAAPNASADVTVVLERILGSATVLCSHDATARDGVDHEMQTILQFMPPYYFARATDQQKALTNSLVRALLTVALKTHDIMEHVAGGAVPTGTKTTVAAINQAVTFHRRTVSVADAAAVFTSLRLLRTNGLPEPVLWNAATEIAEFLFRQEDPDRAEQLTCARIGPTTGNDGSERTVRNVPGLRVGQRGPAKVDGSGGGGGGRGKNGSKKPEGSQRVSQ